MMTCKTCKYWDKDQHNGAVTGQCDMVDNSDLIRIKVDVSDDTGLWVTVITKENFGCIHHQTKDETMTS